jgi:hypothetical protein
VVGQPQAEAGVDPGFPRRFGAVENADHVAEVTRDFGQFISVEQSGA